MIFISAWSMNPTVSRFLLLLALSLPSAALRGQGSLTPPGPPAPTQKSLQEIWDRVSLLEQQNTALRAEVTMLTKGNRLLLGSVFQEQLPWMIERLPAAHLREPRMSLAFGPDGNPALSLEHPSGGQGFAQRGPGGWSITRVDPVAQQAGHLSHLVFDRDGRPAIAYRGPGNLLHLARFNGTTWSSGPINDSSIPLTLQLAFDSAGAPRIVFSEAEGVLKVATLSGGNWSFATIGATTVIPANVAFTPTLEPVFSYGTPTGGLRYSRLVQGVRTEMLVAPTTQYLVPQIVFGAGGHPILLYSESASVQQRIRVARFNGTTWTLSTVDSVDISHASVAVGPNGQPAVAYRNTGHLLFARFNGTAWTAATVDNQVDNQTFPVLAFGPDGLPLIAYRHGDPAQIQIAHRGF